MEALELQQALALEKRMYTLLNEAFDISKQLAEAIERGDQVAIRILLPCGENRWRIYARFALRWRNSGTRLRQRRRVSWRSFSTEPRR